MYHRVGQGDLVEAVCQLQLIRFSFQVPLTSDDSSLADKEAILATLNIKAMTFDDTFGALSKSIYK